MASLLYHQEPELFEIHPQTQKVLNWTKPNSTILELGCHTGLLSRLLVEKKNCIVTGIDINKEAINVAQEYLLDGFILDLEDYPEMEKVLLNKRFDCIILLHVLEHLRNPSKFLSYIRGVLKEDGFIIIGLPNVSNAKERFDMLYGKFEYTNIGVMDRTHISMFNYFTAKKLIEEARLEIEAYYSPWQVNPVKYFLNHLPFLWRIAKNMDDLPWKLFLNKPNLTDSVMLFNCKKND
jgi:2-polyprenyl-3-methyl-5-hydroxy-6-metoxy-1,4-benzoquinol methylase